MDSCGLQKSQRLTARGFHVDTDSNVHLLESGLVTQKFRADVAPDQAARPGDQSWFIKPVPNSLPLEAVIYQSLSYKIKNQFTAQSECKVLVSTIICPSEYMP